MINTACTVLVLSRCLIERFLILSAVIVRVLLKLFPTECDHAFTFLIRSFLPLLGQLQLKVITVATIGIQQDLPLILRGLRGVLWDPL
jgi:hypothetical protein